MSKQKRAYRKRSDYWKKFEKSKVSLEEFSKTQENADAAMPVMVGESLYESQASRLTTSSIQRSKGRKNSAATGMARDRFKNIDDGLLPLEYSADSVSGRDAIELTQKAYFNISSYRSTIDLLSDFSNVDIFLEGGNKKSRDFIQEWFRYVKINSLKSQYFTEYYRSANVFIHRLDGKITTNSAQKLYEAYGATSLTFKIPVRYLLLNPCEINAKGGLNFHEHNYVKALSSFEVSRLKNPKTQQEQKLFESLPEETKKSIRSNNATSEQIEMPLNSDQLHVIFGKKQDYEPLAIPYGFSVLDDINKKLELKKIDQAIARSIENVVLLVTMGAEPDKGGINPKAIDAMQQIFQNQSVGRVLVADYTTKADFIIPDLKKVMGKEKYEVLNRDIQEGLQNVLIGDTKYSDGSLKLNIFLKRLEEPRRKFIEEFLQPEINRICKGLGFKSCPKAKFVEKDILNDEGFMKLTTRMMELGLLTPKQGVEAIEKGKLPDYESMDEAQKEFKKSREEGHYMPLVNSVNLFEGEEMDNVDNNQKSKEGKSNTTKNPAPSGGRPVGQSNASLSKKNIVEVSKKMVDFELMAYREFASKYGLEKIEGTQKNLVDQVCASIVGAKEINEWEATLHDVLADTNKLEEFDLKPEVLDFGAKFQTDDVASAILYHSTKISV